MATLKSLIDQVNFEDVAKILLEIYHKDEPELIEDYEHVFYHLREIEPAKDKPDYFIKIEKVKDSYGEEWYDISGWVPDAEPTPEFGVPLDLALEFEPWANWLAAEIKENVLQTYTPEEIVAHCMWEMTFISFDESEIKKQFGDVIIIIDQEDDVTDNSNGDEENPSDDDEEN